MVSLRPVGGHDALRRAAAREGARLIALSPWRIAPRDDAMTREALDGALRAPRMVFTSPSAVQAAAALQPLRGAPGQWLAVGAGTARALRAAGIAQVAWPRRMQSEALLALPQLQHVGGTAVGLITAPGGRALLASALAARGARIVRADVYAREPVAPATQAVARLHAASGPLWLALSSGEALQRVLDALPAPARQRLLQAHVAAASARLAALAKQSGFRRIVVARGPRPRELVESMVEAHTTG